MAAIPLGLLSRAVGNYLTKRPYNVSFELTHNCNARCRHCHRGAPVPEQVASPARLLEVARELSPVVAILSGGEPLLRKDLEQVASTLKRACPRVFLNTNGALLTHERFARLCAAGVDEVLISLDYPDERHDAYRKIPGLFGRIRDLVAGLEPRDRLRIVLTCVLQSDNFPCAPEIARLARDWGVGVNFSAYTTLRTNDAGLLVQPRQWDEFRRVIDELIAFKHAHDTVLTSDWVLRGMVRFFEAGSVGGCRAGERSLVVNPDGTLSPCGLRVTGYATHADLKREFSARNTCGDCYTSTRGNSERPARHIFLDHIGYLLKRNGN